MKMVKRTKRKSSHMRAQLKVMISEFNIKKKETELLIILLLNPFVFPN
jgi:hypothetical protein